MRYTVNDNCIGCGMCVKICREVFRKTSEEVSTVIVDQVPEEVLDYADSAYRNCPVGAIEVVEE